MTLPPGTLIHDKYRIENLVGQGAFAHVYRATHLDLKAARALKILRRDAEGLGTGEFTDFVQRFRTEAQLGARLNNPHIIRVFDFEPLDETLLLVMELAEGGNLQQRIQNYQKIGQPFPLDEALHMIRDIAEGLGALHKLDVVHRDVKPSNILFDEQRNAKLADLGIAQIAGGPSLRTVVSQGRPHPGTPGYMSPEQERSPAYLTPSADIYSLGLVLFEALTGRIYANQRPGTRPNQLRTEIPQWLDDLLLRMLDENPRQRPWDGEETAKLLFVSSKQQDNKEQQHKAAVEFADRIAERKAIESAQALPISPSMQITPTPQEITPKQITSPQKLQVVDPTQVLIDSMQNVDLPANQRHQAGCLLGEKGWKPADLDDFIEIPLGKFLYGENKTVVYIPLRFWIGKYPVTNHQFYRFMKLGGYSQEEWWSKDGWTWSVNNKRYQPKFWDDSKWNNPIFPVVGVSWYEAEAYCNWLNKQPLPVQIPYGYMARLPNGHEWERAMRGTDGSEYPWGENFNPAFANTYESNLGRTTAVCTYPQGVSPTGTWDMKGNVRELTLPSKLSGGAWNSDHKDVQKSDGHGSYQDGYDWIGFRIVLSLTIPVL